MMSTALAKSFPSLREEGGMPAPLRGSNDAIFRNCSRDQTGGVKQRSRPRSTYCSGCDNEPKKAQTYHQGAPQDQQTRNVRLSSDRQNGDSIYANGKGKAPPPDIEEHPLPQ